jgi:predicted transcriptional regulator
MDKNEQRSILERFRGQGILKENLAKDLNKAQETLNAIIKELKKERLIFGNPVNGTTLYSLTAKGIGFLDGAAYMIDKMKDSRHHR